MSSFGDLFQLWRPQAIFLPEMVTVLKHANAVHLGLTTGQRIARVHADLRMGAPIVIRDGGTAHLVAAVETAGTELVRQFRAVARDGIIYVAITARRARTLAARAYDGDLARLVVPAEADAGWIRSVADPSRDLETPMKGPFRSLRGGSPAVARVAIHQCKQSRLLPAAVVSPVQEHVSLPDEITAQSCDLLCHDEDRSYQLQAVARGNVPLKVSSRSRVHVFRPSDGGEEHYAIEIGVPDRGTPVLTRLHSACFTGDLLDSLKCDCGDQLRTALGEMGKLGAGVLLYLNQEGRGIGLANKLRAYALQDQGFDTVDANHRLGFEDDERDFGLGAEMLRQLGFESVRLMTNNPAKVEFMRRNGITVEARVPLVVEKTGLNAAYLETKARKSGHLL